MKAGSSFKFDSALRRIGGETMLAFRLPLLLLCTLIASIATTKMVAGHGGMLLTASIVDDIETLGGLETTDTITGQRNCFPLPRQLVPANGRDAIEAPLTSSNFAYPLLLLGICLILTYSLKSNSAHSPAIHIRNILKNSLPARASPIVAPIVPCA